MIVLASCIGRSEVREINWEYSGQWKMEMLGLASFEGEEWSLHEWELGGYVPGINPRRRGDGEVVAVLDAGFRSDMGWEIYDMFDGSRSCHDHGSHVAGIVDYLSPGRVICIRVTDGNVFDMDVIRDAIVLAVDEGATVINMSFGGGLADPYNSALYDGVVYASDRGVRLVASAGNSGKLVFPAAYPEVIAVGSLSDTGDRSRNSAVGDTWGYGENVDSVVCAGRREMSGTSMASPMIAALIASGVGADNLWLAGFGVPFNDPGKWYGMNDNGYDIEVCEIVDGKVAFASRIGRVSIFRDDDANMSLSSGDLFGVVENTSGRVWSVAVGRYVY